MVEGPKITLLLFPLSKFTGRIVRTVQYTCLDCRRSVGKIGIIEYMEAHLIRFVALWEIVCEFASVIRVHRRPADWKIYPK